MGTDNKRHRALFYAALICVDPANNSGLWFCPGHTHNSGEGGAEENKEWRLSTEATGHGGMSGGFIV